MIRVQTDDFDVGAELEALRRAAPRAGAVASFVGLVREASAQASITSMTLEHYPGMTEKALRDIADTAASRWEVAATRIIHRVGILYPGDQIVLVAVASAHRAEAFQACEFIMDYLKTQAPFWKKEETGEGARWVASRQSDTLAAERWSAEKQT